MNSRADSKFLQPRDDCIVSRGESDPFCKQVPRPSPLSAPSSSSFPPSLSPSPHPPFPPPPAPQTFSRTPPFISFLLPIFPFPSIRGVAFMLSPDLPSPRPSYLFLPALFLLSSSTLTTSACERRVSTCKYAARHVNRRHAQRAVSPRHHLVLQRLHPNKQALGVLISISFCFGERRRLCAASGGRHCDVACAFPLSPQKHFLPQLELLNELLKRSAPFELPFP